MVIVGSEQLLVDGIYDFLLKHNIRCYNANYDEGALIEGSKSFSKNIMNTLQIPTADMVIRNKHLLKNLIETQENLDHV